MLGPSSNQEFVMKFTPQDYISISLQMMVQMILNGNISNTLSKFFTAAGQRTSCSSVLAGLGLGSPSFICQKEKIVLRIHEGDLTTGLMNMVLDQVDGSTPTRINSFEFLATYKGLASPAAVVFDPSSLWFSITCPIFDQIFESVSPSLVG
jgi:hypothetical protein